MKKRMSLVFCISTIVIFNLMYSIAVAEVNKKDSTSIEATTNYNFKEDMDKVSYIIGTQIGNNFLKQGIDIKIDFLRNGINDALTGKEPPIDKAEQQKIMGEFAMKQHRKKQEEEIEMAKNKLGEENAWKLNLKKPEMMKFDTNKNYFWVLETNKGTMKIKLMPDIAPMHVSSTIFLTKKGFYDNLPFHRIIPGFMAQGGCPLGTGTGGPGYEYKGEFDPKVTHDKPYLLSMANRGEGTDGSQFFLTFKATPWLDGKHTIFGEIVEGQDVMAKLEAAGTQSGKTKEEIIILKARIEEQ
ncbi:MAG: peptidylprolyl isomerase [bacterium]